MNNEKTFIVTVNVSTNQREYEVIAQNVIDAMDKVKKINPNITRIICIKETEKVQ